MVSPWSVLTATCPYLDGLTRNSETELAVHEPDGELTTFFVIPHPLLGKPIEKLAGRT
jgi:hypothetical protein